MNPTKKQVTLLILAAVLVSLFSTSCGTVRGFGQDVETVGGNIEDSAR